MDTKMITQSHFIRPLLFSLILLPINSSATEIADNEKLQMTLESGLIINSNIYRAPDTAYLDYGKTCNPGPNCIAGDDGSNHPYTTPTKNSGAAIPVKFQLEYLKTLDPRNILKTEYRFTGLTHVDSKFSNADQLLHRLNFGNISNYSLDKKQKNELYTGLFIGHKKRLYLDRDSGENQLSGSTDISQRYTYNFYGVELKYRRKHGNIEYKGNFEFITRDYNSTDANVSEYDNVQLGIAGKIKWHIAKPTKLYTEFKIYTLNYSQRSARNELGKLFSSNPDRQYRYSILSIGMRHRLTKNWLLYLDTEYKIRDDSYKGYDNYTKALLKARIHYRVSKTDKLKLTFGVWNRDYENAFAFDNFLHNVKKTYNGNFIKVSNTYQFNSTLLLDVSYQQKQQDSSDLRYSYDRSLLTTTLEWRF